MKKLALYFLLVCLAKFAGAQTESILYSFQSNATDGSTPMAGLVMDASGNFYGTTYSGGSNGTGTLYEISAGVESVLESFVAPGKSGPENGDSALIFDAAGNLYGTTALGGYVQGAQNGGTAFEYTHTSKGPELKFLRAFGGENAPGSPHGAIFDAAGNLWGASLGGGRGGCGVIWELLPTTSGAWSMSQRGDFCFLKVGYAGFDPVGQLAMDASGNFYGATSAGGKGGKGTVYQFNPSTNNITYLVNFNGSDGATPSAGVLLDSLGNLYGTTTAGGSQGMGNVYELSPNGQGGWTETVLFTFSGSNGQAPGALTFDASGNLYGTTASGGTFSGGTAFKLSPPASLATSGWTLTTLWNFGGSGDGRTPVGALILDASGNLYGATQAGGASSVGTVFEIIP